MMDDWTAQFIVDYSWLKIIVIASLEVHALAISIRILHVIFMNAHALYSEREIF